VCLRLLETHMDRLWAGISSKCEDPDQIPIPVISRLNSLRTSLLDLSSCVHPDAKVQVFLRSSAVACVTAGLLVLFPNADSRQELLVRLCTSVEKSQGASKDEDLCFALCRYFSSHSSARVLLATIMASGAIFCCCWYC